MAITLRETYGDRATEPSDEYPGGTFKNENPPGARNGTPLHNLWARDKDGFFQAALSEADIPPLEIGDTATNSQYLKALKVVVPNHPCPSQASLADVCSGLIDVQSHDPSKSPNFLDIGMDIFDSCVGMRPSCWGNFFTPMIYCVTGVSGDLYAIKGPWIHDGDPRAYHPSITWPQTPTGFYSVCSDGDNLYVIWTSAVSGFHVSKLSLTAWTGEPEWTRDTGIPDNALTRKQVKMIVANADNLAILHDTDDDTSTIDFGVTILAKDNSTMVTGTGSNTLGDDGELPVSKLVTDGTHVYWMLRKNNGVDNTYTFSIATANIANPSLYFQPLKNITTVSTSSQEEWPRGFLRVGDNIVTHTQTGLIYLWQYSDGFIGEALKISNLVNPLAEEYDLELGFDGMNIWAQLINAGSSMNVMTLYKIPASEIIPRGATSLAARSYQANAVRMSEIAYIDSLRSGRFLFDRQDLWLVLRNGKFYRVCRPGLR